MIKKSHEGVLYRRAFVVFEVAEHRGVYRDMEIIALIWADRNEAGCHGEAVQVARYVAVHVCQAVSVEIV